MIFDSLQMAEKTINQQTKCAKEMKNFNICLNAKHAW